MTKKQKKMLLRVLVSLVLLVAATLLPFSGWPRLTAFLVPYILIGWDVLWKAVRNIAHGQVFDENFLMALATVGAFCTGEFPEGVAVMLFYQVGELFQSYAVGKSRQSIASLMDIRPDYANIERGGELVQVDPDEVAVGDTIVIKSGEKVPLDGVVLEGASTLNTAALTGESLPRDVEPGDDVISGCINQSGLLKVRVTKVFGESTVARILDLVENSSAQKAKAENFITKFARYYTPVVVIAALILGIVPPLFVGDWSNWIHRALIFLVISCPCALVISVPLSFFGGIGGTKVGALCGEAVVFPHGAPAHFMTMVKQQGALLAKGRLMGLQFDVLFTDDLYTRISRNAIETADRLKEGLAAKGYRFYMESPTNQVFPILENSQLEALEPLAKFGFWEKYDDTHTVMRIATSWATRMEEIEQLIDLM